MRHQVKNYQNNNQVVSSSTSANVKGMSRQSIRLIKYEILSALHDPEMLSEHKSRLHEAYCEFLAFTKGGGL